jgi:hypothetical protein
MVCQDRLGTNIPWIGNLGTEMRFISFSAMKLHLPMSVRLENRTQNGVAHGSGIAVHRGTRKASQRAGQGQLSQLHNRCLYQVLCRHQPERCPVFFQSESRRVCSLSPQGRCSTPTPRPGAHPSAPSATPAVSFRSRSPRLPSPATSRSTRPGLCHPSISATGRASPSTSGRCPRPSQVRKHLFLCRFSYKKDHHLPKQARDNQKKQLIEENGVHFACRRARGLRVVAGAGRAARQWWGL